MKIQYSRQAVKFLAKQNTATKKRIVADINKLPAGYGDIKKLQGKMDTAYVLAISGLSLTKMVIFYILKKSKTVDRSIKNR